MDIKLIRSISLILFVGDKMPCQSEYSEPGPEYYRIKEELDFTTRLLCGSLRDLRKHDQSAYERLIESNAELRAWWIRHQKYDRERLKRERRQAIQDVKHLERERQVVEARLHKARLKLERSK